MTRRGFVTACCVLLSATSMFAQSRRKRRIRCPEPGPESCFGRARLIPPVTMELKFDGKSAVTGTVSGLPSPADVKTGTFDPKTGALKLQLGKKGEAAVLLTARRHRRQSHGHRPRHRRRRDRRVQDRRSHDSRLAETAVPAFSGCQRWPS